MDDFAKFYGTWLASAKKNSIPLVVDYGAKNEIVEDVWKATTNVPTTGQTKTNIATGQTKTNISTTTNPLTQPVSEPLAKPVVKPLTQPVTKAAPSNVFAQLGTRGPVVTNLQTKLQQLNYNLGPKGVDGKFGYDTQRALVQFQKDNGLKADGILGPETNKKLNISSVQPPAKSQFM
jgi:peptidoglycan hydrolase-like protein with peptidoglycan-binding domain